MKNISEKEKNLLDQLKTGKDVNLVFKDKTKWELEYDKQDKVYRTKKEGFYQITIEYLFDVVKGLDEEVELI